MPHDLLSGTRSNSGFVQHRGQCHAHGMNIDDSPTVVRLGDASGLQVTIQSPEQTGWHGEQWQMAELVFRSCEACPLLCNPCPQFNDKIGSQRNL